ncbi:hypothetical protein [Arthrobacter sp. ok909]|uniref:hypothetical protein n=1 Tax=Arthrobacter sp. ok909 TaxID=1761746 RepID=UPI0011132F6A|nr:hypothetical protein [Arthrobacter sp. ok909]
MKRRTGIILAAVLIVGAAGLFLIRSAEDRVTADMVSRAERFTIPADWKLQDNIVRREMFLCMSTNPCPSIARRWDAGRRLTVDDLKAVGSTAGFAMTIEGTCTRRPSVGGTTTVCSTSGTDGEYDYKFNVSSPDKSDSTNFVVFQVEPHS